jgi:hypothetical protein
MPTNDDTPKLEPLAEAGIADDDLIQVYDVSQQKIKKVTCADLIDYIVLKTTASEA